MDGEASGVVEPAGAPAFSLLPLVRCTTWCAYMQMPSEHSVSPPAVFPVPGNELGPILKAPPIWPLQDHTSHRLLLLRYLELKLTLHAER
jgi:hypothetical protein